MRNYGHRNRQRHLLNDAARCPRRNQDLFESPIVRLNSRILSRYHGHDRVECRRQGLDRTGQQHNNVMRNRWEVSTVVREDLSDVFSNAATLCVERLRPVMSKALRFKERSPDRPF